MKLTHRIVTGLVAVCTHPALVHPATVQQWKGKQGIIGDDMIKSVLKGDSREAFTRLFLPERNLPGIRDCVAPHDPGKTLVPMVPPRQRLPPSRTVSLLHRYKWGIPVTLAWQHHGQSRTRSTGRTMHPGCHTGNQKNDRVGQRSPGGGRNRRGRQAF